MSRRCAYVTSCDRQVRWRYGDFGYCTYHWHFTWMCGCKKHRRVRDV